MKEKPEQVLSLLPGEYYHPDAEYEENYFKTLLQRGHRVNGKRHGIWESYRLNGTHLEWRGHYLHEKPHGVWEGYRPDETLKWRHHYLHEKPHGVWEGYRYNGISEKLECYSEGNQVPFFIESLLGIPILDI